ncbi:hypothetical protein HDU86_004341 [Geranomyces michiganensis]|nr:hypothetical protein HDU86_004341 [Geranomyces michiganensis]
MLGPLAGPSGRCEAPQSLQGGLLGPSTAAAIETEHEPSHSGVADRRNARHDFTTDDDRRDAPFPGKFLQDGPAGPSAAAGSLPTALGKRTRKEDHDGPAESPSSTKSQDAI